MTMQEIEKRVQTLEDIEAIKRLKARYGQACDDNYNPEKIARLFTEDGIWDGGEGWGIYRGREKIKEYFTQLTKVVGFAVHYFVMPDITVESDKAYGRWYLWMPATLTDGRAIWIAAVEDDQYARVNGKWLTSYMKLTTLIQAPYDVGWDKERIMQSPL